MSGRKSKINGKAKKAENAIQTTKDKNDEKVIVTTLEVTVGSSRGQNAERVHYKRMRGNSAQATSPDNPKVSKYSQRVRVHTLTRVLYRIMAQ